MVIDRAAAIPLKSRLLGTTRRPFGHSMDIDIFQLPGIVRKRIHYVIFAAIACVLLALGFLATQKPFYRSTAELFVDIQRGPVVGTDTGAALNIQQLIGSQLYVLQSRDVLRDVVKRLDLEKDPYFAGGGGMLSGLLGRRAPQGDATDGIVDAILENLLVARNGDTFVFTVTVKHGDSEMAAKIANAIAESYLRVADTSRLDINLRTTKTISEQTEELRKRVLDAQSAVETFRVENGLIATGEQGLIIDQQLAGLNQQLIAARQQVEQQKTVYDQARQLNMSNVESGAIPEALQSASLSGLRSRYAQTLDRQAELSANLGDGHPQMRAVRSQLGSIRKEIEKELVRIRQLTANTYERATTNLASLQKRFDEQTTSNNDHGNVRFRLTQLISEAEAIDAVYKSFLTRAEELGRQQDIGNGNSRIISAAVPSGKPVQAPKILVLIAAVMFGTAAGAALAVVREIFGGTLRSESDLVSKTGVPVLAVIEPDTEHRTGPGWSEKLVRAVPFRQDSGRRNSGRQNATSLNAGRHAARDTAPRVSGLTRAAHLLQAQFAAGVPVTVAVLSAGDSGHDGAAFGIAEALQALGEDVLFSHGDFRRASHGGLRSTGSVRVRTDLARPMHNSPRDHAQALEDILEFERLGAGGLRRVNALSSARVSTSFRDRAPDFTIIDCCATPAESILPAILKHVDGILVVSAIGATGSQALSALLAEIGPWREKLVGNILVGDRAA
jgi:succinoglycan biosynthesis transport protein ExoP